MPDSLWVHHQRSIAAGWLRQLMLSAAEGPHVLTIATVAADAPTVAQTPFLHEDGQLDAPSEEAEMAVTALAVALTGPHGDCVFMPSPNLDPVPESCTLTGWQVREHELSALTGSELRTVLSIDPATGEPAAPDPGVEYADATSLRWPQTYPA